MIVKVVPTLRHSGDKVRFDAQYFETKTVYHEKKWVAWKDRGKHRENLDLNVGDYWIECAEPAKAPKQICESILILDSGPKDEFDQRTLYITGLHAIYLMNDEGKTIDTLIHL